MLPELLQRTNLFSLLYRIDCDLAAQAQKQNCVCCHTRVYVANYQRKPRGGPDNIPDEFMVRHSFCCSREGCRKRHLPPSCRFLGRKVYWGAAIIVVMALRQNRPESASVNKLQKMFDISRKTICRWIRYFQEVFPSSPRWKRIRGRITSQVNNNQLPGGLFWYFVEHSESREAGLVGCLYFLSTGQADSVW